MTPASTSPFKLLRRMRRALWYAVAALAITAAVLLSLTRLLLPNLQDYRAEVERKASEVIGQPVRIRTLNAHLLGLEPTVILEDVRLLDGKGVRTIAHFRQARIGIDVIASLRRRHVVVSELTVVGAELTLLRLRDGRLKVQGLAGAAAAAATGGGDAKVEGIGRWLLGQGRLALFDSRVHWRDLQSGRNFELKRVDIELRNRDTRHQLNIDVQLPPGVGHGLHLALDLTGDVLQPDGWSGDAYLSAEQVRPVPWWQGVLPGTALTLAAGRFDLHLWGHWQAGRVTEVAGKMAADNLVLRRQDGRELAMNRVASALHWQRGGSGWTLGLGDLQLQRSAAPVKPQQLSLRHQDGGWQLQAGAIDLADVAAITPFVPGIGERPPAIVAALQPRGVISQLRLTLPAQGPLQIQGEVAHLAVARWEHVPGIDDLSGRFMWRGDDGRLLLDGSGVTIDATQLFRAPLQLEQLQGAVDVHHDSSGWRIATQRLQIASPDISAELAATVTLPLQGAPYLDLLGRFWNGHAASTSRYLPAHIMQPEALAWLDHAFRAGTVTSGGVLFHGPLNAFPFDHGEGRFEVGFHVRDAELFFRDGWPSIKQLDAQVSFVNRRMTIKAGSGTMYDSRIQQATVTIANLERPLLAVRGIARLQGDDALRLLRDTPLRKHLGNYAAGLKLEGDSTLRLALDVPLTDSVAKAHPLTVNGSVVLQDNRLSVGNGFSFDAIGGTLRFDAKGLYAKRLQARILGEPATVTVATEGHGSAARTVIRGRGRLQAAALSRLYATPLLVRLSGQTAWYGTLDIPHSGGSTVLHLSSELNGMAVKLPAPLGKSAKYRRRLTVTRYFSGRRNGELAVGYGRSASLALLFGADGNLVRGNLHLGHGHAHLPGRKVLRISGSMRDFDPSLWAGMVPSGHGGMSLPLSVDMDELHIVPGKGGTGHALSDNAWHGIPTLDVNIKRFGYGKYQFAHLSFHLDHSRDALRLRDLLLTGESMKLTGQVRWQWRPRSYSEIKLQLASDNVATLAKQFGIASVITRGKLAGSGEFHWPGPLTHANLRELGGQIHMKIEDGRMENVDPGAGRLLGLFSLQALPQHLTLDFSDLFQKGLVFNSLGGDTTIRGGSAYTSNLVMNAPSATIHIEGRTGLVKRDFNQLITVVPNLSGTAPVVGTLAFGPQVGALLYLFERLLGKKVDRAAQTQYRVTGSWDKPVFKRLEPPKKAVPKKAAPVDGEFTGYP